MRILQVYDLSGANDGPGHQMARLRSGLEDRGHEVRLFASRVKAAPGPDADYMAFGTTDPKGQVLSQTFNPGAYRTLKRALADFAPDVVHVRQFLWQLSPLILPLLRRVPTVYHISHYKAICPVATKLLPDGSVCRDLAGRACLGHGCVTPQTWVFMMAQIRMFQRWQDVFDRYVALSGAMKSRLEAEGIAPVEVVHNAIAPRPIRRHLARTPMVVYAGRLADPKGVNVLLQAWPQVLRAVPDAHLLIAGAGPARGRLEELGRAVDPGGSLTFTGHLSRSVMEERFDPAWVQVVPSLWEEPFGNVVTEAMMRGTAVVASATGGIREIIRDGIDGVLVPPGDVADLARAMTVLLTDPREAARLGEAGHRRAVQAFGEDRLVDRMEEIFREAVEGARMSGIR